MERCEMKEAQPCCPDLGLYNMDWPIGCPWLSPHPWLPTTITVYKEHDHASSKIQQYKKQAKLITLLKAYGCKKTLWGLIDSSMHWKGVALIHNCCSPKNSQKNCANCDFYEMARKTSASNLHWKGVVLILSCCSWMAILSPPRHSQWRSILLMIWLTSSLATTC